MLSFWSQKTFIEIHHVSVCSWFLDSAKIYSPFGMIQLTSSVICMAITIFNIDSVSFCHWIHWPRQFFHTNPYLFAFFQQLGHIDLTMVIIILSVSINLSNLLIYCYFGKWASESYEKMCDCVFFNLNWHKFPIESQKYILVMITNMQKPINYHGFGIVKLDLETFALVIVEIEIFSIFLLVAEELVARLRNS